MTEIYYLRSKLSLVILGMKVFHNYLTLSYNNFNIIKNNRKPSAYFYYFTTIAYSLPAFANYVNILLL